MKVPTLDELRGSEDLREDIGELIDTDPLAVRDLLIEAINRLDDHEGPIR